jgi:hypothetical protein
MSREYVLVLRMKHIIGITVIIVIIGILSYMYYSSLQESTASQIPQINPRSQATISIDLSIPSKTYRVGEEISISGIVKIGEESFKGMYVQLVLMDSRNNTVWIGQVKTNDEGVFRYNYRISGDVEEGKYTLYAITIFGERRFDYEELTITK